MQRLAQREVSASLGTFQNMHPEQYSIKLRPGELIVMVSDGVTQGADDAWLCKLLSKLEKPCARELAKNIVNCAAEFFGDDDDMTAIVIFVEERT